MMIGRHTTLYSFQWLGLYFLLIPYVRTDWPSSPSSNIQLVGLFPDTSNTSKPTTLSVHSRAMFQAAVILSQQYNITIEEQFIGWQSVQTGGDGMNGLSNVCLLMSASNIVGIVGPAFSSESHFIAPFAAKIGIPVISYGSTDPELSDRNTYPAFYRTVPSDNVAALAIIQLFIQFNWTSCIIIYQNDEFGSGGARVINEAFQNNDFIVTDMIVFDIATQTIRGDLKYILTRSSSRIVILWAIPTYSSLILQKALDCDVIGPQYTWILSSIVPLGSFNQTSYEKLNGILTIVPVVGNVVNAPINTTLLNAAYDIWQQYEPESFPGSDNVNYYALFAFDATWTLIQALQQFCSMTTIQFVNTSFCFDRYFLNSSLFYNIIDSNTFLGVSGAIQFNINVTDRITGIYYVTKNLQSYLNRLNYVPVLVRADSNGWTPYTPTSVIVWPGNSLIPPSSYASLSGVTLRIAVTETDPFTKVTQVTDTFGQTTTKLTGYMPDLIDLLQNKMGFIPSITLVTNQAFNDIVNAVANDVYDMFVAQTTITAARTENVTFSTSIFDNSLRVIIRKDSAAVVDLLSYLRPFSLQIWITLLAACVYAGFLICLLERQENKALRDRSIISQIGMSTWFSVGTVVGYGVDFHVRTAAGRVLTVGLYILSLVLVAAYTANLTSDLTISKSTNIISGIDDIKNGKLSYSRIGIVVGTSFEDYYLREISGGIRNFYPLNSKQEIYDCLLNNTIDASIMDAPVLEYVTGNIYCNLTAVGTDFDTSAFGIVFQKKWQYEQVLDVNILSLKESGALDYLKRKWFQASYCSQSAESSVAMKIESMAGLFLTFAVITILAVLVFAYKNRYIMNNYLLKLTHRKNLLAEQDACAQRNSNKTSSEHPSISKSPTLYL